MEGLPDDEWREGEGKNRWRYQAGSDRKVCEIELTQGKVALVDADRLADVLPYRWYTWRPAHYTHDAYYACGVPSGPRVKRRPMLMHAFLFPDMPKPRDHIDRNGLNNTRSNLRNGGHGVNQRNRLTLKQDQGVTVLSASKRVRVTWCERNGRTRIREFPWSQYVTPEAAYEAAVVFRKQEVERIMGEITAAQAADPHHDIERYVPGPQTNKTGRKYVQIKKRPNRSPSAVATIRIDNVIRCKSFTASLYGGNIDEAADAAHEWAVAMREAHPKKRYKPE